MNGLVVAGGAVVLTGEAVELALGAALIAIKARRANGLPEHRYRALAEELNRARSATGHSDVPEVPLVQHFPEAEVPIAVAAQRLRICERQMRRLAPQFGRKVGGRWLIDDAALRDEQDRRSSTT